jgi:hypothetical protein
MIAQLHCSFGRPQARLYILGIQRSELDLHLGGAFLVATLLAAIADGLEELLGVGESTLLGGDLTRSEQRVLIVGLELQDLLEEGGGFRVETLGFEMVGNPRELRDASIDLSSPHVEVAKSIGRIPVTGVRLDYLLVLGNSDIDAPLP